MTPRSSASAQSALGRFFFAQTAPDTLGVVRALVGGYLVVSLLFLTPFVLRYMPDGGPLSFELMRREIGEQSITLLSLFRGTFSIALLHVLAIAAAVCVMLGKWTRWSTLLLYVIYLSYVSGTLNIWDGGDAVTTNILFLLTLAGFAGHSQAAYSLDAARARREGAPFAPTIPVWSIRLIQLQICFIYFFAGWYKTQFIEWQSGEALHYVFQQLAFSTLPTWKLSYWPALLSLFTTFVLFLELLAPALLWVRSLKTPMVALLIALQIGIRLTIHVFSFGILVPLLLVFIEPDTMRRLVRAVVGQR